MSPTQRTQQHLRLSGFLVANCERKIPCTPAGYRGRLVTQDLFGIIDTLAIHPLAHGSMLAIQSTAGAAHGARRTKILGSEVTAVWLRYAALEVWSWSKRGGRGKRKLWTLRREAFRVVRGNVEAYDPDAAWLEALRCEGKVASCQTRGRKSSVANK